jgi:hypothetical protein
MKLPQLTLRDLFWLVLVIALSLGWWLDRKAIIARMSDEFEKESAALRFFTSAVSVYLAEHGKPFDMSRDEVQIDGMSFKRANWIDQDKLEEERWKASNP